jgi:penicillin-insensitive murein endopeptidase
MHYELLQTAASSATVERIFVNPAIKKHLCSVAQGDRHWLAKLRPWWGHDDHFHARLRCPAGDRMCIPQGPLPPGDGCGKSLDWWFGAEAGQPQAQGVEVARHLPHECRHVLRQ